MKIAWRAITDADEARLVKNYNLTETELKILQLRRKGETPTAIALKVFYSRIRMYVHNEKLMAKIVQMYQENG